MMRNTHEYHFGEAVENVGYGGKRIVRWNHSMMNVRQTYTVEHIQKGLLD